MLTINCLTTKNNTTNQIDNENTDYIGVEENKEENVQEYQPDNSQQKDEQEKELITYLLQDYLTISNLSVKTFLEFKNLGYDLKLENDE